MLLNIKRNIFQSMLYIPALGYLDIRVIYPRGVRIVKLVSIPPSFVWWQYLWYIFTQTGVGCYNLWAAIRCLGCSPLEKKILWKGTIYLYSNFRGYFGSQGWWLCFIIVPSIYLLTEMVCIRMLMAYLLLWLRSKYRSLDLCQGVVVRGGGGGGGGIGRGFRFRFTRFI